MNYLCFNEMGTQGSPILMLQEKERFCAFMELEVRILNSASTDGFCLAEAKCQLSIPAKELLCVRKLSCNCEPENPIPC